MLCRATAFTADNHRREEVKVTCIVEKRWSIGTFQNIDVLSIAVVEEVAYAKSSGITTKDFAGKKNVFFLCKKYTTKG